LGPAVKHPAVGTSFYDAGTAINPCGGGCIGADFLVSQ